MHSYPLLQKQSSCPAASVIGVRLSVSPLVVILEWTCLYMFRGNVKCLLSHQGSSWNYKNDINTQIYIHLKYKPGQLIFQDDPFSEMSDGESSASFVYSSCPFIKKRKPSRSVAFSESVTEYYEIPLSSSDGSNQDEDVYEEPCRYFWPQNKHFFPRQVWQGLRRYARCEHTWDGMPQSNKLNLTLVWNVNLGFHS